MCSVTHTSPCERVVIIEIAETSRFIYTWELPCSWSLLSELCCYEKFSNIQPSDLRIQHHRGVNTVFKTHMFLFTHQTLQIHHLWEYNYKIANMRRNIIYQKSPAAHVLCKSCLSVSH